ncbi:hypothetical protein L6452_01289 [Arctium lappa]|uniref:Uncharacterized protein n=1 Tax=Arctium lappa TaxID=4217 RepID=A0ACB9FGP6_ARCLA|nr:hypothetical protein L6452_01289 [Arctium lappa]
MATVTPKLAIDTPSPTIRLVALNSRQSSLHGSTTRFGPAITPQHGFDSDGSMLANKRVQDWLDSNINNHNLMPKDTQNIPFQDQ